MATQLLIGTYTRNTESEGIYAFDYDPATHDIEACAVTRGIDNPSFLAQHPTLNVVYAVNEIGDFQGRGGAVSSFMVTAAALQRSSQVTSLGADPCHLEIDPGGRFLIVSNYSGGSFTSLSLDAQGRVRQCQSHVQHSGHSVDPERQSSAHVHSGRLASLGKNIYFADLGLDQLVRYPIDEAGIVAAERAESSPVHAGAGPRHFCFDQSGNYCYVINELDNTLVTFSVDAGGALTRQYVTSALPADFAGLSYCGEVQLSGQGRFVYVSNRGHDSIAVFEIEAQGRPMPRQHIGSGGVHPRHFSFSLDGELLVVANRDSNNLCCFDVDAQTGKLTATGTEIFVPAPVCVLFLEI